MEVSQQSAGLRRYSDVLVAPGVARVVCAALLGRLPIGMGPLATVLLLRGEGHSYAVTGVVVAVGSLASAGGLPLWGRLVDRVGQVRVLVPLGIVYPAAFAALALLATQGAPVAALIACSGAGRGGAAPARCVHARDLAEPARDPRPARHRLRARGLVAGGVLRLRPAARRCHRRGRDAVGRHRDAAAS